MYIMTVIDELLDFNFDDIDIKNILIFQINLDKLKKYIDEFRIKTTGFEDITNGAFGYIDNPYRDIGTKVDKFYTMIELLEEHLNPEFLLYLVSYKGNIPLRKDIFFPKDYSYSFGKKDRIDTFIRILKELKECFLLYKKATTETETILKKYMKFPDNGERNGKEYIQDGTTFTIITPHDDVLHHNDYFLLKDNWEIGTDAGIISLDNEYYHQLNKKYFPEYFI